MPQTSSKVVLVTYKKPVAFKKNQTEIIWVGFINWKSVKSFSLPTAATGFAQVTTNPQHAKKPIVIVML